MKTISPKLLAELSSNSVPMFPVVVLPSNNIGSGTDTDLSSSFFLSTRGKTLTYGDSFSNGNSINKFACNPILLSVSEITERVNFETKEFAVNNVSLKISNLPFKVGILNTAGTHSLMAEDRFSELVNVGESNQGQLIGMPIDIHYVTESTTNIFRYDQEETTADYYGLRVFRGVIIKAKVDGDFVTIGAENLSPEVLKKQIPEPSKSLGESATKEEDKEKYIPHIFGYVPKAPAYIVTGPIANEVLDAHTCQTWGYPEPNFVLLNGYYNGELGTTESEFALDEPDDSPIKNTIYGSRRFASGSMHAANIYVWGGGGYANVWLRNPSIEVPQRFSGYEPLDFTDGATGGAPANDDPDSNKGWDFMTGYPDESYNNSSGAISNWLHPIPNGERNIGYGISAGRKGNTVQANLLPVVIFRKITNLSTHVYKLFPLGNDYSNDGSTPDYPDPTWVTLTNSIGEGATMQQINDGLTKRPNTTSYDDFWVRIQGVVPIALFDTTANGGGVLGHGSSISLQIDLDSGWKDIPCKTLLGLSMEDHQSGILKWNGSHAPYTSDADKRMVAPLLIFRPFCRDVDDLSYPGMSDNISNSNYPVCKIEGDGRTMPCSIGWNYAYANLWNNQNRTLAGLGNNSKALNYDNIWGGNGVGNNEAIQSWQGTVHTSDNRCISLHTDIVTSEAAIDAQGDWAESNEASSSIYGGLSWNKVSELNSFNIGLGIIGLKNNNPWVSTFTGNSDDDVSTTEMSGKSMAIGSDEDAWALDFYGLNVIHLGLMQDILGQDYYADVSGGNTSNIGTIVKDMIKNLFDPGAQFDGGESAFASSFTSSQIANSYMGWALHKPTSLEEVIKNINQCTTAVLNVTGNGKYSFSAIKLGYTTTENAKLINPHEVLDFKVEPKGDVHTGCIVKYQTDYARNTLSKTTPLKKADEIFPDYSKDFYLMNEDRVLTIEAPYVNDDGYANALRDYHLALSCNTHSYIDITVPLTTAISLEAGDLIAFPEELNQIFPYGKGYSLSSFHGMGQGSELFKLNGQYVYPLFVITTLRKSGDKCKISAMQLHHLASGGFEFEGRWWGPDGWNNNPVYGCSDPDALNYAGSDVIDHHTTPCYYTPPEYTAADTPAEQAEAMANFVWSFRLYELSGYGNNPFLQHVSTNENNPIVNQMQTFDIVDGPIEISWKNTTNYGENLSYDTDDQWVYDTDGNFIQSYPGMTALLEDYPDGFPSTNTATYATRVTATITPGAGSSWSEYSHYITFGTSDEWLENEDGEKIYQQRIPPMVFVRPEDIIDGYYQDFNIGATSSGAYNDIINNRVIIVIPSEDVEWTITLTIRSVKTISINDAYDIDLGYANNGQHFVCMMSVLMDSEWGEIPFEQWTKPTFVVKNSAGTETPPPSGDVNGDGNLSVLDVVLIINEILYGGVLDDEGVYNADITNDGTLNVLDVVVLVNTILG